MQVVAAYGARVPGRTTTLKETARVDLVHVALHLGYRHLDTAQMYDRMRTRGEGLRASGVKRDDVFVTTKVWFSRLAAGDFERSVDESLDKLAMPWVDLLMIHWPNAQIPLAELIGASRKSSAPERPNTSGRRNLR